MSDYKFETKAIHSGNKTDSSLSRAVPVYRTSAFLFKSTDHAANLYAMKEEGFVYTRLGNPTQEVLEKRLASIEGGKESVVFSTGTQAVFSAIINICESGDEIVSGSNLYGGTITLFKDILPQFRINTRFVDPLDPSNFEKEINDKTRLLYMETIGNPRLDFTDISAVSAIAKKYNLPLVVDSTFTPPCMLRPIEYGADIIIHSLTKWINGHGTALGGAVIDAGKFDWQDKKFRLYCEADGSYHGLRFAYDLGEENNLAFIRRLRAVPLRNLGGCLSVDNVWYFLQGLETLSLRMERHCSNALKVAEFLENHSKVGWIRYPGLKNDASHQTASKYLKNSFGGMVVFGLKGGIPPCKKFIENLKLFSHCANVGDAKSLAIHPASTTHSQMSDEELISAGLHDLVRLSVGIEHIDDIIRDIKGALDSI
jgi:O-acetylhomoserine (thiol)-lyase